MTKYAWSGTRSFNISYVGSYHQKVFKVINESSYVGSYHQKVFKVINESSHLPITVLILRGFCFCICVGFILTYLGGSGCRNTRQQYEKKEEEWKLGSRLTPVWCTEGGTGNN
jgi:hypothetical protein